MWGGGFKCATNQAFGANEPGSATWLAGSPAWLAASSQPAGPVLLVHSPGDDWVQSQQATTLYNVLKQPVAPNTTGHRLDISGECGEGQHPDVIRGGSAGKLAACIAAMVPGTASTTARATNSLGTTVTSSVTSSATSTATTTATTSATSTHSPTSTQTFSPSTTPSTSPTSTPTSSGTTLQTLQSTSSISLITTTTTTTTTITATWLGVNAKCDPLADACDNSTNLACAADVYECRYTTTTMPTTATTGAPGGSPATTNRRHKATRTVVAVVVVLVVLLVLAGGCWCFVVGRHRNSQQDNAGGDGELGPVAIEMVNTNLHANATDLQYAGYALLGASPSPTASGGVCVGGGAAPPALLLLPDIYAVPLGGDRHRVVPAVTNPVYQSADGPPD